MNYGVLTICRNSAATVRRAVASVLAQSVAPAQYVFVDGGSSDGTPELLATLSAEASRTHPAAEFLILNQAGDGIPQAWNQGLAALRTQLVFILNSDDWYEPHAAATVLGQFTDQPDIDILLAPVAFRDGEAGASRWVRAPKAFLLFPFLMPVMHPGCFVKRAVYQKLGGFDESYRISADYDFVYRCLRAGMVFGRLSEPLVHMQIGGLAAQNRGTARRETLAIGLKYSRFPLFPLAAYVLRALLRR